MRIGVLSFTFILTALIFAPALIFGQKAATDQVPSVRQTVDSQALNLERNLARTKLPLEKFKLIEKFEKEIRQIREKSPRQFEKDEIEMDQLLAILDQLPQPASFKREQCASYKNTLAAHFDPVSENGQTQLAPLKTTFEILKELCKTP